VFEVEGIMIKDVVKVRGTDSVESAMKLLLEHNISGLPVVDDNDVLVGVITEKDVLKLIFDEIITQKQLVKDFMTREVVSFGPRDGVVKVADFFINNFIRRLPVVDEDNKLVGIIARRDIIRLILDVRKQT